MDESYPDARPEPIGHSGTNESVLSASVIPGLPVNLENYRNIENICFGGGFHIFLSIYLLAPPNK